MRLPILTKPLRCGALSSISNSKKKNNKQNKQLKDGSASVRHQSQPSSNTDTKDNVVRNKHTG